MYIAHRFEYALHFRLTFFQTTMFHPATVGLVIRVLEFITPCFVRLGVDSRLDHCHWVILAPKYKPHRVFEGLLLNA